MKKTIIAFTLCVSALLAGCTVTSPNVPSGGNPFVMEAKKVKKWNSVTYEYESFEEGCSEVKFLKKFAGKSMKTNHGSMVIDNILDIHSNVVGRQIAIMGLKSRKQYKCSFWGLAVEYER